MKPVSFSAFNEFPKIRNFSAPGAQDREPVSSLIKRVYTRLIEINSELSGVPPSRGSGVTGSSLPRALPGKLLFVYDLDLPVEHFRRNPADRRV